MKAKKRVMEGRKERVSIIRGWRMKERGWVEDGWRMDGREKEGKQKKPCSFIS